MKHGALCDMHASSRNIILVANSILAITPVSTRCAHAPYTDGTDYEPDVIKSDDSMS